MPDEINEPTEGPSRRQLIKRAAVGSAIVWTAPALSSVTSPASAVSAAGCGQGWMCSDPFGPTECGTAPSGSVCLCYAETTPNGGSTGQSFCGQNFGCGQFTETCGPDGACPPGFRCQSGCCGNNICAPLCGTDVVQVQRIGDGRTNRG